MGETQKGNPLIMKVFSLCDVIAGVSEQKISLGKMLFIGMDVYLCDELPAKKSLLALSVGKEPAVGSSLFKPVR
jgi:hypothetical protein